MPPDDEPLKVDCARHGARIAAVLCGHLLREDGDRVRFVENSSLPDDLQASCDACERKFAEQGSMTPAFLAFNKMAVVCTDCYEEARRRHAREGSS